MSDIKNFTDPEAFHQQLAKVEESTAPEETVAEQPEAVLSDAPEQPVTEAEAPEAEADEDIDFEETPQGKMIPKGRFNKELQKRKELEQRYQDQQIKSAQLEREHELLKQAVQSLYGPQGQPTAAEKPEEFIPIDEEAHRYYGQQIEELKAQQKALTQQQRATLFRAEVKMQELDFAKSHPDLSDAFGYLQTVKSKEYVELGFSESEARTLTQNELQQKAARIWESGKDVAAMAYNLAKTYGYTPKGKTASKQGPNLDAIRSNMDKSASVGSIATVAGGPRVPDLKESFTKTRSVDANKFQELLASVQAAAR